jgi:hypothetical protein
VGRVGARGGSLPRGRFGAGGGVLARLLRIYRTGQYTPNEAVTPYLGEAYWRAGEYEKGRAVLDEVLLIIEPCSMRVFAAIARRILGEIAAKTDPARAASFFDRSIAVLLETRAEPELALGYAGYGCGIAGVRVWQTMSLGRGPRGG